MLFFFFGVNSNTYLKIHENNNNNDDDDVLNQVYNTLRNQNTTTKGSNLCSCRFFFLVNSNTY